MSQGRDRVYFLVSHDLDPIPGSNHTAEDARVYQIYLQSHLRHYNPQVTVVTDLSNVPMVHLPGVAELAKRALPVIHKDYFLDQLLNHTEGDGCIVDDHGLHTKPEEVALGDDRFTDPSTA